MSAVSGGRRRSLVLATVALVVAGVGLTAPQRAVGVAPCNVSVTRLALKDSTPFASGARLNRYRASVNYPGGTTYDQTETALLAMYPAGVSLSLLSSKISERTKTGDMVRAQEPQALAAVNGDFFTTETVNGQDLPISRGPMVKDGRILRADRTRRRVIGVDTLGHPYGESMGVRGSIQSGPAPSVAVEGVNWGTVHRGGATIFTPRWSAAAPRPSGVVEWVINGRGLITETRSLGTNAAKLGAPVSVGTRVVAFSRDVSPIGEAGVVGDKARVNLRQITNTGVTLDTAMGRGITLVDNGVAAPLDCSLYSHSKDARPRTLIGWNSNGAWRTLTVPGREFTASLFRDGGFGLANEAAIAKRLRLVQAYELDGGGSTTLYTRNTRGRWARRDLFGVRGGNYERTVPNGFAFVAPVG